MWENIVLILEIIGSLGLFLYGMKIMSDNIQKAAGSKLRQILESMTRNRFMGVLTGFIITCIIQSSSATTVMVVSFVNAGLLSLIQAIGVIMGANIGTTLTAWIVSLGLKISLSKMSIFFIAIGFPLLFFKREKIKFAGETIIGFAILFIGLGLLKDLAPDKDQVPEFVGFISDISNYGFFSTILFVLIGTGLTVILQSSSAAMAVTLTMCLSGLIDLEAGAAIVLGENIGTTITANLAALIGNVHAKRSALAHTFFNVAGVVWMLVVFKSFVGAVDWAIVNWGGMESAYTNDASILIALSVFHTSFNIINTLVLVWFANFIAKVVTKVLPSKTDDDEQFQLEYIRGGFVTTPELSVMESGKEIIHYAEITNKMYTFIPKLLNETDPKKFKKLFERIDKYENIIDRVEIEIAEFLVEVSQNELSVRSSNKIRAMLRVNSNLEKMGDICFHLSITIDKKNKDKAWFTAQQRERLNEMFGLIDKAFEVMMENMEVKYGEGDIMKAAEIEKLINKQRDLMRDTHFESIEKGDYNIKSGLYYNNIYNSLEKLGDLILNVNEAVTNKNLE